MSQVNYNYEEYLCAPVRNYFSWLPITRLEVENMLLSCNRKNNVGMAISQ